jgi:hypothetical protein
MLYLHCFIGRLRNEAGEGFLATLGFFFQEKKSVLEAVVVQSNSNRSKSVLNQF